jgi:WD40 repeat protein
MDNARPLSYSPDGKTLASGYLNSVKIWDAATGRELRQLGGRSGLVQCVAYSLDSKTLAFGQSGGRVEVWDLASDSERATIGVQAAFGSSAFTADGKTLAIGNNVVRLWDLSILKEQALLRGGDWEEFEDASISPDGNTVVANSHGKVRIWRREPNTWREQSAITGHGWHASLAISPDGKLLAVGGDALKLYDLATGKERLAFQGLTGGIFSISFSRAGNVMVSGGYDRTVRVWDVGTGQQQMSLPHSRIVHAVALAPDGKQVAAMCSDAIRVWDVAPAEKEGVFRHSSGGLSGDIIEVARYAGGVSSVAFSADGKTLVSLGSGERKFWDDRGQEIASLPPAKIGGTRVALTPDGKTLVTSGLPDGRVEVWNSAGRREALLQGHALAANDLAMSPDGKTVATTSQDGSLIVWDLKTQRVRQTIKLGGWLSAVAFSPDGKTLAVGAQFGIVRLIDAETGTVIATPLGFEIANTFAISLAFSPNGKVLAVGTREGLVRLLDLETGHLLASLKGHTNAVASVTFSPDGQTVATACEDRKIKLWDVVTGQERVTLNGHTAPVLSVAFAPNGAALASGSLDGTVRLWRIGTEAEARAYKHELDPDDPESPVASNDLGDRLWQDGQTGQAEDAYRNALARLERLAAAPASDSGYQQELVRGWLSLSSLLMQANRAGEAESARQRATRLYQKLSSADQQALIFSYSERLRRLLSSGLFAQAERTYSQSERLDPRVRNPWVENNLAWRLATCPDLKMRNSNRALELARKAVELAPNEGNYWNTLGVAQYRSGDWKTAIASLTKSNELLKGNELSFNAFFLAMANWQLGNKDKSRKWFHQAVEWMDKNKPKDEELIRFRAEAEELLKIQKKPG